MGASPSQPDYAPSSSFEVRLGDGLLRELAGDNTLRAVEPVGPPSAAPTHALRASEKVENQPLFSKETHELSLLLDTAKALAAETDEVLKDATLVRHSRNKLKPATALCAEQREAVVRCIHSVVNRATSDEVCTAALHSLPPGHPSKRDATLCKPLVDYYASCAANI